MAYSSIRVEREGAIARLVLDRPDARNAMTPAMGEEVEAAVRELRADPDVRVVVVTGAGSAFCAGGDLGMLARDVGLAEGDAPTMAGEPGAFYRRFLSVHDLPVPTIAAINGHAIGAGLCLALACDIRIAAAEARMGLTFVKLGIHPGMGATYFLPRLVGPSRAAELLFTGRIVDAAEAERLGLVDRVVPRAELAETVGNLAAEIASAAPLAVRLARRALRRGARHSLEEMLDFEALQQAVTFRTDDAREGVRAVREKRPPRFSGR